MDRFLIAPFNTGLQTNLKPFLIMDDAFTTIQNAYVWRGRVRKRFGSNLMGASQLNSRLRINIGTVAAHTIPGGSTQLQIGQMFSVGADIFTIFQLGAAASTLSTNAGATATINSTSNPNTVTFTGEPNGSTVYYYPANPVMGIDQYNSGTLNNHPTYAFDTQFAYLYSSGAWNRSGTAVWHGSNLNFFWATNWQNTPGSIYFFVTNFNATTGAAKPAATDDPIWYTGDGSTWTAMLGSSANGIFYFPAGGAVQTGPFVQTARIILPFKNRLVLLSTIENDNSATGGVGTATAYPNRARYSFEGSPLAVNAWYMQNQTDSSGNTAGGGGAIDAATDEQIVSAEFIKDHLIVYFERSTWELAFTGNEELPFVWNKLNNELGSQSTFSTVPFDKEVLTIGNTGIHSCNGSNVARIDDKIPDEIFDFKTENMDTLRTFGIRDYYTEMVYWTFLADLEQSTQTFPNQILCYNYKNQTWSLNDDCFTAFGYFEQEPDITWASLNNTTWAQWNGTWESLTLQANQRRILGGTPEGFVLLINPDTARNAPAAQITNIGPAPLVMPLPGQFASPTGILTLTIINHNFAGSPSYFPDDEDFILIENVVADASTMTFLNGTIFPVYAVLDSNTIQINTFGGLTTGTYYGSGTTAHVSNVQIQSKQWNPYDKDDRNVHLHRIDFGVQKTATGAITVDYFPSASPVSMIQGGTASGAIMGNSVLETFPYGLSYTVSPTGVITPTGLEQFQERLWHPIFFQSDGECIQIRMYMTGAQMINPNISLSEFELQGMILYTQPTTDRLQ